jgi:hypothetical protein
MFSRRVGPHMVSIFNMMAFGEGSLILRALPSFSHGNIRSGYEMLRYPKLSTSDLKEAIPELSSIDPQLLARIDIDGSNQVYLGMKG